MIAAAIDLGRVMSKLSAARLYRSALLVAGLAGAYVTIPQHQVLLTVAVLFVSGGFAVVEAQGSFIAVVVARQATFESLTMRHAIDSALGDEDLGVAPDRDQGLWARATSQAQGELGSGPLATPKHTATFLLKYVGGDVGLVTVAICLAILFGP